VAALTCTVWDALLNVDLELRYIWRRPVTWIKRLFVFTRCFGVVAQLANLMLTLFLLDTVPLDSSACRVWFIWQLVSTRILLSSVEIILGLRVLALYDMNRKIGLLLIAMHLAGFVLTLSFGLRTIDGLEYGYGCNATSDSYFDVTLFVSASLIRHGIMWFLTARRKHAAQVEGWAKSPILILVARDSGCIFIALTGKFTRCFWL